MAQKKTYYVWYDLDDAKDMLKGIAFRSQNGVREWAVEEAAIHFWNQCDGWEWMKGGCTLYSSADHDKTIYSHEVTVDFDPTFYSAEGEPI